MRRWIARRNDSYYGWKIVYTLAFTETVSYGILYYAFTVFITPMETELGWSRAELTGGFSLSLLVMGAMAFPVGRWVDMHGSRLLMTLGSILASVLVVAWSRVTGLGAFYAIWAGLGVCGAAVLYEPAFAVVATWFDRKRARALTIITFAAGFASTIFVPLSDKLLGIFGWRDAVLVLGIFLALTTIPLHALVLRRHPHDRGILADGAATGSERPTLTGKTLSEALHSRFFWLITLAFGLGMLASSAIRVHFIPFLIGSGIDPSTAALASGSIGLMQVAGRVIFASAERRLSHRALMAGLFALQSTAMGALLLGTTPLLVGLFIVIFGTSFGAMTLMRATIIADFFGATHYGRISSIMAIFLTLATTAAPVGAGIMFERFQSYTPVLWAILILMLAATGLMAFTRPVAQPLHRAGE